ncbi:MAG: GNAT family N-acetyltransferase, partial [Cyclobacteriaceae bacterium]
MEHDEMTIRKAKHEDLAAIVHMLSDDELGSKREDYRQPLPKAYEEAFNSINKDKNQELMVVTNARGEVVGTLQLTFIQYLTYKGGVRTQIEAVRIRKDQRGKGLGKELFEWVINRSKARGAHVLQLTTDKQRPDAIHFYEDLGFVASHEGMKIH